MNTLRTTPQDRFYALDETITRIKDAHAADQMAMRDELVQARANEVAMRDLLHYAQEDRDRYMRLATKLIAQFGAVELIFSEAKKLAMAYAESEAGRNEAQDPAELTQTEPASLTPNTYTDTLSAIERAIEPQYYEEQTHGKR